MFTRSRHEDSPGVFLRDTGAVLFLHDSLHGCRLSLRKRKLPTLVLASNFVEAASHFPPYGRTPQRGPRGHPQCRGASRIHPGKRH